MAFASSSTYIYLYVAFAVVYMASSLSFVFTALRVSTALSRAHDPVVTPEENAFRPGPGPEVGAFIAHSQRLIDYTQLATLLPLGYVVGSMFLGSLILGGSGHVAVNFGWIALTVLAMGAAVAFSVLGSRESRALGTPKVPIGTTARSNAILQRIGMRLGVSAAMLVLMTVFMLLNLYSVLSGMQDLLGAQFLI